MEHKNIKWIELVYENCDYHRLESNMFSNLIIKHIYKNYYIDGTVREYIHCKEFSIVVNKKGMDSVSPTDDWRKYNLIKRIKSCSDITHINIVFEDLSNEYISVPWGKEEYTNTKQKNEFKKNELKITIK